MNSILKEKYSPQHSFIKDIQHFNKSCFSVAELFQLTVQSSRRCVGVLKETMGRSGASGVLGAVVRVEGVDQ